MHIYEIENIKFRYPGVDRDVLTGVNLVVGEGEVLTILGPNGSGKSTLLDCMAGLRAHTSGVIRLTGTDIRELKPREVARVVGYVPQMHVPAFSYTVLDFVLMGRAPNIGVFQKPGEEDAAAAYAALEEVGVEHLASRPYTDISGGERQQATIARAVCQQPKVILFDEPTAHLDYGNQHRILQLIRRLSRRGYAIVITTHNPDHALLLSGAAAILGRDGKLVCGESGEILTEPRLRELYGLDLSIIRVEQAGRVACLAPRLDDDTDGADGTDDTDDTDDTDGAEGAEGAESAESAEDTL